jgi:hypothetical protein
MTVYRWIVLVVLSLPLSIELVIAAPQADPEKLPMVACSDLKWNAEFLAKYPKAPAACQEARVYKARDSKLRLDAIPQRRGQTATTLLRQRPKKNEKMFYPRGTRAVMRHRQTPPLLEILSSSDRRAARYSLDSRRAPLGLSPSTGAQSHQRSHA